MQQGRQAHHDMSVSHAFLSRYSFSVERRDAAAEKIYRSGKAARKLISVAQGNRLGT